MKIEITERTLATIAHGLGLMPYHLAAPILNDLQIQVERQKAEQSDAPGDIKLGTEQPSTVHD